jgi:hypothetical protein
MQGFIDCTHADDEVPYLAFKRDRLIMDVNVGVRFSTNLLHTFHLLSNFGISQYFLYYTGCSGYGGA